MSVPSLISSPLTLASYSSPFLVLPFPGPVLNTNSTINSYNSYHAPSSTTALYMDKDVKTWQEKGRELLNEPSVTSLGKIFDWVFGLGNFRRDKTQINYYSKKEPTAVVSTIDGKFLTSSIKKEQDTSQDINAYRTKVYGQLNSDASAYISINQFYFNCKVPNFSNTGVEPFNLFAEVIMNNWGDAPANPSEFQWNYPTCINQRVLGLYYQAVAQSPAAQSCQFDLNERQIYFNFPTATIYFAGDADRLFVNQTTIPISDELVNECYNQNLTPPKAPDPKFDLRSDQTTYMHLKGFYQVRFANFYCASDYSKQNIDVYFPSSRSSRFFNIFHSIFLHKYTQCTTNAIEHYFQQIESDEICRPIDSNLLSLAYKIGEVGNFIVSSPEGLITGQENVPSPDTLIEECFDKYTRNQRYGRNLTLTIYIIGAASLSVITFCRLSKSDLVKKITSSSSGAKVVEEV